MNKFLLFSMTITSFLFCLGDSNNYLIKDYSKASSISSELEQRIIYLNEYKAFPTAEGYGKYATGGEDGRIIEVTNLNDRGRGSLRDAVEFSIGPRIVHFSVAGNIVLKSPLSIKFGNLTVAGETAPGKGIAIVSESADSKIRGSLFTTETSNVVFRFLRFRRRGEANGPNSGGGGILGNPHETVENIIFDHCTWSWMSDDMTGAAYYSANNITYQNCFFYEGIRKSQDAHRVGSKGTLFYSQIANLSLISCAWAHCGDRSPFATSNNVDSNFEMINLFVYNHGQSGMKLGVRGDVGFGKPKNITGSLKVNVVGCYYKSGLDTFKNRYDISMNYDNSKTSIYVKDNITKHRKSIKQDEWDVMGMGANSNIKADKSFQSLKPFKMEFEINEAIPSNKVQKYVTDNVGSNIVRDESDLRVINNMLEGKGRIIQELAPITKTYPILDGKPWKYKKGTLIPENFAIQHRISSNTQVVKIWDFKNVQVINKINATAYQMWRWSRAGDFDKKN